MVTALNASTLRSETVPVAAIIGFWTALSVPVAQFPTLAAGLRLAGLVLALGYVVVRGVALARSVRPDPVSLEVRIIVREQIHLLRAAGVWLLPALACYAVPDLLAGLVLDAGFRPVVLLANTAGFVLTASGVATVALYTVVVTTARTGDRRATDPEPSTDADATTGD
jgi:hypothetical protein